MGEKWRTGPAYLGAVCGRGAVPGQGAAGPASAGAQAAARRVPAPRGGAARLGGARDLGPGAERYAVLLHADAAARIRGLGQHTSQDSQISF